MVTKFKTFLKVMWQVGSFLIAYLVGISHHRSNYVSVSLFKDRKDLNHHRFTYFTEQKASKFT